MSQNIVIETRNLEHIYKGGTVKALNGVNLTIRENEFVSIVGQNGSGKTTIVRHFNGLLKPTSGEVFVNGESVEGKSVSDLSRIVGYVFQNPNHQLFSKTVKEELEVGPNNFGLSEQEKKANMDRAIELLNLQDILNINPLLLDYTTKKIVSIASILTFDPKILIMDEPTGGLDEPGREMLVKVIDLMREIGHTIILISHDMDFVAEHSQRIVVMANAQIIKDTNAKEVFRDDQTLAKAKIEPPQITMLDKALSKNMDSSALALSVREFVNNFKT